MTLDLYGPFLEQTAEECFLCSGNGSNLKEKTFIKQRFHPKNNGENFKLHKQIAKLMEEIPGLEGDCETAIGTTCKLVVHALVTTYNSEMTMDGVDIKELLHCKRGQRGPWKKVYSWLHDFKFPRWRSDFIWQTWQDQAPFNQDWICFCEKDCRGMRVPTPLPPSNQIEMNKPLIMHINLDHSEQYLLLLNRGKDKQGKETKYLVCPSQAFAPQIEPIRNLKCLPLSGAMLPEIIFNATGEEEYLGIVVNNIPENIPWLNPNPQEPAPQWDKVRIYQLWQELEQQAVCQFFYQSFEVVSP